jgi:hypothetical protein
MSELIGIKKDVMATDHMETLTERVHFSLAHAGPKLQAQLDRIEKLLSTLLDEIAPSRKSE